MKLCSEMNEINVKMVVRYVAFNNQHVQGKEVDVFYSN